MKIISSREEMRETSASTRREGKRIGFVPTMGFLHEGHLSLVDLAKRESDHVVLSIFVNPVQFGPNEDFTSYPRDFERDTELARSRGVNTVFHPAVEDIYSPTHAVYVEDTGISRLLCGASRPGHFRGVLTVVAKLFNIVQPDVAVFGQKDAQQARLIQRMTDDLDFPVRVLLGPIIREQDGLALSSRNAYLSKTERIEALCLVQALKLAKTLYNQGERSARAMIRRIKKQVGLVTSARIDYVDVVDYRTFEHVDKIDQPVIVLLAVWIGKTRLIDNLILPENPLCNLPD